MFLLIGVFFALSGAALLIWGVRSTNPAPDHESFEDYLQSLEYGEADVDEFQQLLQDPFLHRVLRPMTSALIGTASGVLPSHLREKVHHQLVLAGLSSRYRAEEVVTAQMLAGGAGLAIGLFFVLVGGVSTGLGLLMLIGLPVVGVLAPRSILDRKAGERQEQILRDLPDTLDLLAISVEAGVGFDGALGIVSDNFDTPLGREFSRTLQEMSLGLSRRQALDNLKRRTAVPDLDNFIMTLTQADALGMPIGRVLTTQAGEMRNKRRAWAREKYS